MLSLLKALSILFKIMSSSLTAKPVTDLPQTVGKSLDLRNRVENRIAKLQEKLEQKNPFWSSGTPPANAMETVQTALDRFQVLFELNEMINVVSVLKQSDVVVPSFVPEVPEYRLTLSQLRDADKYLLKYFKQLEEAVSNQLNIVNNECDAHNLQIEKGLKDEWTKLENKFKDECEKAKKYNEPLPKDTELEEDKQRARRRAQANYAVKIDPINIRQFLPSLRQFVSFLEDKRNDKIDACNAETTINEIQQLHKMREMANEAMKNGVVEQVLVAKEGTTVMSMADLNSRMTGLDDEIQDAIRSTCFVSYKQGQDAQVINPDVHDGKRRLTAINLNINVMIQYRQIHRETMACRLVAFHPLTHVPCSLDSLVRLGYTNSNTQKNGQLLANTKSHKRGKYRRDTPIITMIQEPRQYQQKSENTNSSLSAILYLLEKLMNTTQEEITTEQNKHDAIITNSISEKQEARSKSGSSVKGSELDEIAESVRTANEKKWLVADNFDEACERVNKILEEVQSLQSSERKSSNATIRVVVPNTVPMTWMNYTDEFNGW